MAGEIDPGGHRERSLDEFLAAKLSEGFRLETRTDTHAIIVRRGRVWSRLRSGRGNRYVVQVDEHGNVTMRPAEPIRA